MAFLRRVWKESQAYRLAVWFDRILIPQVKVLFHASFVRRAWLWTDKHIVQSRLVQQFIDPTYLTNAWYASFFYQKGSLAVRRLAAYTPRASLRWDSLYTGGFLAVLLLIPHRFCTDLLLLGIFLLAAIFYFSHHAQQRAGVAFGLVNGILLLFWGILALALPGQAVRSLTYLLLGIDFFFFISLAVREVTDFLKMLRCLYCILLILCGWGLWQQDMAGITARAAFSGGVAFGKIIVLLFPFAFGAPMTYEPRARQVLHLVFLLMLTFTAVTATRSRAAFVGFSAELLLLILLIDWRYLPLLLFLAPAMTGTAIENITAMWSQPKSYDNFFVQLFYSFQAFWQNGFGVNRSAFLDFYSTAALLSAGEPSAKLSPAYFGFLLELGMLGLFGFFIYLLRIARSTLTAVFTAPKELRSFFAAGFAMLVGISVSSLLESTFFAPRTLLVYWGMLGLLRAARIIRYTAS